MSFDNISWKNGAAEKECSGNLEVPVVTTVDLRRWTPSTPRHPAEPRVWGSFDFDFSSVVVLRVAPSQPATSLSFHRVFASSSQPSQAIATCAYHHFNCRRYHHRHTMITIAAAAITTGTRSSPPATASLQAHGH
jgi:hypothetical protein